MFSMIVFYSIRLNDNKLQNISLRLLNNEQLDGEGIYY